MKDPVFAEYETTNQEKWMNQDFHYPIYSRLFWCYTKIKSYIAIMSNIDLKKPSITFLSKNVFFILKVTFGSKEGSS